MTDLNEKLKLVAFYVGLELKIGFGFYEYGGKRIFHDTSEMKYHTDYNEQIPVWQKVCNEGVNIDIKNVSQEDYNKWSDIRDKFLNRICFDTPLESFEILVQAIQFINNLKTAFATAPKIANQQ